MSQQCKCKKGHASLIDGKCSNCRTKKEQQAWLNRPSRQLLISVVNKHHGHSGEYIGRGSPIGNKWTHLDSKFPDVIKVPTRAQAVAEYAKWLDEQIKADNPVVVNELNRLGALALQGQLNLQCFCCPQACHGDIIKDVLFKAISKTYTDTHWWIS